MPLHIPPTHIRTVAHLRLPKTEITRPLASCAVPPTHLHQVPFSRCQRCLCSDRPAQSSSQVSITASPAGPRRRRQHCRCSHLPCLAATLLLLLLLLLTALTLLLLLLLLTGQILTRCNPNLLTPSHPRRTTRVIPARRRGWITPIITRVVTAARRGRARRWGDP